MKRHQFSIIGGTLALSLSLCAPAQAASVEGVFFPDAVELGQRKLVLNGMGIRNKFIVKVYVAGLYLEQKAVTSQHALTQAGAKRLVMTLLRDIESDELARLFLKGMQDNNTRNEQGRLLPFFLSMSQLFSKYKRLNKGDTVSIDFVPEQGMRISIRGQVEETGVKDPAYMTAMLSIWLGNQPADQFLKEALLGKIVEPEPESKKSRR